MESSAFLTLGAIIVLNTLSGVLAMGIDQYVLVYFMNHGDMATGLLQKGLLTSGYGIVGFAAIPVITWLGAKFGKSGSLYFVYGLMVIGGLAKWFIFTLGHPIIHLGKVAASRYRWLISTLGWAVLKRRKRSRGCGFF